MALLSSPPKPVDTPGPLSLTIVLLTHHSQRLRLRPRRYPKQRHLP